MKGKIMLMFVLAALLFAGTAAFGQDGDFCGGPPPGPPPFEEDEGGRGAKMQERMMAELHRDIGLSDEQDAKLREMKKGEMERVRDLHRELRRKQEQMRLELDRYNSDMDKINVLIEEINAAHNALVRNRVEAITQLKKVLTREQFDLLVKKMRIRMEVRRELRRKKTSGPKSGGKGGGPF